MSAPVLRVARACSDLGLARRFYREGLGLPVLGEFADHAGFVGLIVGETGAGRHLELVVERGAVLARPSPGDLIVLYEPDRATFEARVEQVRAAGFAEVSSSNPYWDQCGVAFERPDGYRPCSPAGAGWTA